MIIFPAIDIRKGKCVRLEQGNFAKEQIYGEDPVEVARKWENQGARYLHLVDLDGACRGMPQHREIIGQIVRVVKIPVQAGGGSEPSKI
ncbi:1-(5-phosphoribosyl)-5-[(5-phosphoribosylamino)methylideneamino] imidazole-4-carboxamide isomerase [Thermotalea metallivorans]|uniref:1-(5-phosphoribosyl)-5-[(5-phosphoribosylamino)methylideneamino] imidazole-4-carboxamide isomerase n=1 Tax=Thermotalea metallivorans TaxID=520762 RepID=A0A140L9I3_9FIRM|nr:HisA/HisF-related TIM barrel protein [Thermotalea metallivorans]KXG77208.1 1-(5-phosphoribosyl)-5-[(5-phosphoribosylamino)methylideneamino] imidazole-4-carboxamide isomerase [Thermotalea metallivorans]